MSKMFDLNIEEVLEHWELKHALREIIANANDEQIITNTQDIEIFKDNNEKWHIKDYGRGLQDVHFTQNENKEKLSSDKLIGKFGVGLKDALAVFNRHKVEVLIHSRWSKVTFKMNEKNGFEIKTLHALFEDSNFPAMIGT